jgi:hypothetical protein
MPDEKAGLKGEAADGAEFGSFRASDILSTDENAGVDVAAAVRSGELHVIRYK